MSRDLVWLSSPNLRRLKEKHPSPKGERVLVELDVTKNSALSRKAKLVDIP
jgi:hypothetical protein